MSKAFTFGRPVTGRSFYGRSQLLRSLVSPYAGGWKWLCATRRIGKTSVLKQLQISETSTERAVLYFGFDSLTQGEFSASGILRALCDVNEPTLRKLGISTADLEREPNGIRGLRELVERILAQRTELLLLIDEADDFITLEEKDRGVLSQLRSQLDAFAGVEIIIAATQALTELYRHDCADFLGTFEYVAMGALDTAEALALLSCAQSGGWRTPLPTAASEQLIEYSGGHPYALQWFGNYLAGALDFHGSRLSERSLTVCIQAFLEDRIVSGTFADDYSRLSAAQRQLLRALCQHESLSVADLQTLTSLPLATLERAGAELTQFGYIHTADRFRLRFQFFRALLPQEEPRLLVSEEDVTRSRSEHRNRPTVVVLYSHKDEAVLNALSKVLTPGLRGYNLERWHERRLGDKVSTPAALLDDINRAEAALVLISPDYLAQPALCGAALEALLHRSESGLPLCPLHVRASLFSEVARSGKTAFSRLARKKALNQPAAPLLKLKGAALDQELVRIAQAVLLLLEATRQAR